MSENLSDSFRSLEEWLSRPVLPPIHFPQSGSERDRVAVNEIYSKVGREFHDGEFASRKLDLIRRLSPSPECILFERRRQIETVKRFDDFIKANSLTAESWQECSEKRKIELVQKLVAIHSDVCGQTAGIIVSDRTPGRSGEYKSGYLYVDLSRGLVDVVGTAVHENTHHHQDQIRQDDRALSGPLKSLVEILRVTWNQTELDLHYMDRPREAHARDWQYVIEDGVKVVLGVIPVGDLDLNREYPTQYRTKPFDSGEQRGQGSGLNF